MVADCDGWLPREINCGLSPDFEAFLPQPSGNLSAVPLGTIDHQIFQCRIGGLEIYRRK
jgi:hypothetical protein